MRIWKLILCCVLVAAFSAASIYLYRGPLEVTAVWPANAVLLAFLMRGYSDWRERRTVLVFAFFSMVAANFACGLAPLQALTFPLANVAEVAAAVWFLRKTALPFRGLKAFGLFLLGVVIAAPLASTAIAAIPLAMSSGGSGAKLWLDLFQWFAADAMGMAIFAPFALAMKPIRFDRTVEVRSVVACFGAQALVLAVTLVTFSQTFVPPAPTIFPVVMLAVFANRRLGAAMANLIVAVVALGATAAGYGPVAHNFGPYAPLAVQVLLASLVLTSFPVAAMLQELHALRRAAEKQSVEAHRLSDIKTRFLGYVSHEIRSPLSGLVTVSELLQHETEVTPKQKELLQIIAASGREIEALSRDLTDAAAIQAGEIKLSPTRVVLAELVGAAIQAAQFRTKGLNATIEVVPVDVTVQVWADPQRMRQVLVNLLTNACKYGGSPPRVRISAAAAGRAVRFTIEDNGPGIPLERRAALFQSYNRLGAEHTTVEGVGLGLTLCQEIVRLHGGRIGVDDSPMGGARFWVEVPQSARARLAA
ncbi:MAG: ATP-binding protein [Caulobacteraceae bacterium]